MNINTKKWIEASLILEKDKEVKVVCPECGKGMLIVKDEEIVGQTRFDRYLTCDTCGKWNVLMMRYD